MRRFSDYLVAGLGFDGGYGLARSRNCHFALDHAQLD